MFQPIFKANPYHDEQGRFTAHYNASHVSTTGVFAKNSSLEAIARRMELALPRVTGGESDHPLFRSMLIEHAEERHRLGKLDDRELAAVKDDVMGMGYDLYGQDVGKMFGVRIDTKFNGAKNAYEMVATEWDLSTVNGVHGYAADAMAMMLGQRTREVRLVIKDEVKTFDHDGVSGTVAGEYYSEPLNGQNTLVLYKEHNDNVQKLLRVLSHEVSHHKYHSVVRSQGEKHGAAADFTLLDIQKAWASPDLKTDAKGYLAAHPSLIASDGVTSYSKEWWGAAVRGDARHYQAVDETLAEIATLSPSERAKKVKKPWLDLFKKVNAMFEAKP